MREAGAGLSMQANGSRAAKIENNSCKLARFAPLQTVWRATGVFRAHYDS